ncbi:MAG: hypothetical protein M4579_002671 [Chaenotheca gracillima]|nr:MAG: hypothetical protein M4579_002671 [Chaenotheca gracillima]
MPQVVGDGVGANGVTLCKRCQELEATLIVRSEPCCRDCFKKYVGVKVAKRMDTYRVRNTVDGDPPSLLLPMSYGISSLTLLQLLDSHLKSQVQRTRRSGFSLKVVHVEESPGSSSKASASLERVKQTYPDHEYLSVPLADISRYGNLLEEVLSKDVPISGEASESLSSQEKLDSCLQTLPSATSRADILIVLRTRLIVEIAKERGCEGIVWGDTTTRLAERTLAETAKGRGHALPWQMDDGISPLGVTFKYPLRDILKKEILSFAELFPESILSLVDTESSVSQVSASSKGTSIDDLMRQYFGSVEENFPSIVANVVKTSGKLRATSFDNETSKCVLCSMPIPDGGLGPENWSGNQEGSDDPAFEARSRRAEGLCYGCARSALYD